MTEAAAASAQTKQSFYSRFLYIIYMFPSCFSHIVMVFIHNNIALLGV